MDILGDNLPKFDTWQAVVDCINATNGRGVRYFCPCNLPIAKATVMQRDGKSVVRIVPIDKSYDPFTADEGHLARFRRIP